MNQNGKTQELSTLPQTPTTLPLPPLAEKVERVLGRVSHSMLLNGGRVESDCALTAEQVGYLENRLGLIDGYLRTASQDEIRRELLALYAVLDAPNAGDADIAAATINEMVVILFGLPLATLKQACSDFKRGSRGDGKWVPKAAQIRLAANEIAQIHRAEQTRIMKAIDAPVLPPIAVPLARKAELLAKARSMTAQMAVRGKANPDAKSAPETPEEALDRLAKTPLPKFSAELAAKLGLSH